MKSSEELNALKAEVETLNAKLAELNEEELAQVAGGTDSTDDWLKPPKKTLEFLYNAEDAGHKPGPLYRELPKDLF